MSDYMEIIPLAIAAYLAGFFFWNRKQNAEPMTNINRKIENNPGPSPTIRSPENGYFRNVGYFPKFPRRTGFVDKFDREYGL
jgi:hypothetical protein